MLEKELRCLKIDRDLTDYAVDEATAVLKEGGIIAYPTETFYGLGARFDIAASLQRLYDLKGRPKEKAMPLIIGDVQLLKKVVSEKWITNPPHVAGLLIRSFWPGPLTLLFPAKEGLSGYLSADTGKVAVRVPGDSFALRLARKAGFPITATSANLSGKPPAREADEVKGYFGDAVNLVIDGGATPGGFPSTIIDVTGGDLRIVREGIVSRGRIEQFCKGLTEEN